MPHSVADERAPQPAKVGAVHRPAPCSFLTVLAIAAGLVLSSLAPAAEPVRVVSQTVGSDELLLALAKPGQVAALSHLARDPAFSGVAAEAAGYPQLTLGDAETILKFSPTLVLFADYSRPELVAQVRRAGVRIITFDHYKTLDDVYANLRALARELGAPERAEELIARCQTRMAKLDERLRDVKPVRVIAPSTYGLIGGADTTFQDLCDHAGAENVAATHGHLTGHVPPPEEQMLQWPIDMVVVAGSSIDEALAPFRDLPPYQFLAVIKESHAVLVEPWQLSCVSHLRIDGYETLARALHPDAFAEASP